MKFDLDVLFFMFSPLKIPNYNLGNTNAWKPWKIKSVAQVSFSKNPQFNFM